MSAIAVIYGREALIRGARFDPVREFKRSHKVIKAAHRATMADGRLDYGTALKAADLNLKLADAYPRPNDTSGDPGRPVAVQIILTGGTGTHAGAALQTHGVRLHLSEHNGDSA